MRPIAAAAELRLVGICGRRRVKIGELNCSRDSQKFTRRQATPNASSIELAQGRGPPRSVASAKQGRDMRIGIIGAGRIGRAFATQLARAGIKTTISNSRGPESLSALVGEIGPRVTAGTVAEAAEPEIVLVAVPWRNLP